jgi:hypothetical protein
MLITASLAPGLHARNRDGTGNTASGTLGGSTRAGFRLLLEIKMNMGAKRSLGLELITVAKTLDDGHWNFCHILVKSSAGENFRAASRLAQITLYKRQIARN